VLVYVGVCVCVTRFSENMCRLPLWVEVRRNVQFLHGRRSFLFHDRRIVRHRTIEDELPPFAGEEKRGEVPSAGVEHVDNVPKN
jgi:hypothetical protein